MKLKNHGQALGRQGAEIVRAAPTTRTAKAELEELLRSTTPPLRSGWIKASGDAASLGRVDENLVENATSQSRVLERRLEQVLRVLRREGQGRASPAAQRVLVHDAARLLIEAKAWATVATLGRDLQSGSSGPSVVSIRDASSRDASSQASAKLRTLLRHLESTDLGRHAILSSLVFASPEKASEELAPKAGPLSEAAQTALSDILNSSDPQYRDLVMEPLRHGVPLAKMKPMLLERMPRISATASENVEAEDAALAAGGMMFDLGTNTFVQKDLSWAYEVSLEQLFDYEVDGICDGREELKARLVSAATDPTTGDVVGASREAIEKFVDDLADAADSKLVDDVLGQRFTLCFSTTDFSRTPVRADWELPNRTLADLFALMSDDGARDKIALAAEQTRQSRADERQSRLSPLSDLLEKYPGVPRRHKRAHAALINLGLAGQSIREMGKPDGVLPKSETILDPAALASERYKDADHLKLRFLFTDEFELYVISDAKFQEVVDKHHFPPNHELLSYNRPIAGSGYLTIHQGKIVALEDDTIMLKGKMPEGLPPALEILSALEFPLDKESIAESTRVLDWESFSDLASAEKLPEAPRGTPQEIRAQLASCPHSERSGLVASALKEQIAELREQRLPEPDVAARATDFAEQILDGFQIINVSAKHFRDGELPADLNEFMELRIDDKLAPFLVKRMSS